jgi:hypothetical protein
MNKVPKKEDGFNISCALFSLGIPWPFKIGLIGCDKMLVRNYHSTQCNTSEECRSLILAMQALVWLDIVWFRAIQFGSVQFSVSYMNLR